MSRRRRSTAVGGTAIAPPSRTLDDVIATTARPVPQVPGQQPLVDDGPLIGSFCTGYGGLDTAVQEVFGGSLGWVSDVDPGACKILAHRHPHVPNIGDLTVADYQQIVDTFGRPYAVCGGYPCQPFSLAGGLKGTEDERHLWPYIARALGVLRPRYAIFENVANHLRLGFDTVLCDLADLGFDVEWDVVRADEVGAPHQRRRLIILATAADAPHLGHERGGSARGRRVGPADHGVSAADAECGGWQGERSDTGARQERPAPASVGRGPAGDGAAPADAASVGRGKGRAEPARKQGRPGAALGGGATVADPHGDGREEQQRSEPGVGAWGDADGCGAERWGRFASAVARWEAATGRRAPWATNDRRRLNPEFVEWMMGLPAGHVTAVPGLTRNEQLKALGNGVVPQQAAAALRMMLGRSSRDGRHAA